MKQKIKIIFLAILFIVAIACEKESEEAKEDAYNFALLTSDCSYLEKYYADLDASNKEYSAEEAYFYASTVSTCANFNAVALLSINSAQSDIYSILSAYLSKEYLKEEEVDKINSAQNKILKLCKTYMMEEVEEEGVKKMKYADSRADILCSLTNVASSSLDTLQATTFLSDTKILPLTSEGLSKTLTSLTSGNKFKDKAAIIKSLENFFDIKAGESTDNITKEEAMQEVVDKLLDAKNNDSFMGLIGGSFAGDIDKYVDQITTTDVSGKKVVTAESIADYLESILK